MFQRLIIQGLYYSYVSYIRMEMAANSREKLNKAKKDNKNAFGIVSL